ncbi:hypothetical protein ACFPRA_01515 [Sporosarcina soli]|uniref:CopG family transcriptional regulator n=1 Tax=Sporosarcina soli TaxID=334736 RepID=A0ABW0TFZ9_9BACL
MRVTIELIDHVIEMLERFRKKRVATFERFADDALKTFGEEASESWLRRAEEYRRIPLDSLAMDYLDYQTVKEDELDG